MLTDLNVLDLSRVLAGPVCSMMLGDLGAHVVKIERPDGGDETRGWGPPFGPRGVSAYFSSVNRNKLSVCADLDSDADVALVRHLIEGADVVIENFRGGMLERREVGPLAMRTVHPRLVWCTVSGFGAGVDRPGYDFVVQAESGWMSITGQPDGVPMKHGLALVDVLAGKDAAVAILAALVARATTGVGRHVEISLKASAEAALINVAQNTLVSGVPPRRWGNAHANLVPYQLFDAADGAIVIAVGSDAQWAACVRALELTDLADDASLLTNTGRLGQRDRIVAGIAARVRTRRVGEWMRLFARNGVPAGQVRSVPEVLASVSASSATGMPPSVPGTVRLPPPQLGEHTALVRVHGWSAFAALDSGDGSDE